MLTRLDIINAMMRAIGGRPFLANQTSHPQYQKANQLLEEVEATVQQMGWWFNTEVREFTRNTDGEVKLPTNTVRADVVDGNIDYVQRGNRMYDKVKATFCLDYDPHLRITQVLDFDLTPMVFRDYVKARCRYEMFLDTGGADPRLSSLRRDRDMCWEKLYAEELRNRNTNMFLNGHNTVARLRRGVAPYNTGTNARRFRRL